MENGSEDGIVVVGSGGHAKVVIELLRAMGETVSHCIGGVNDAPHCLGVPVLAGDHHLALLRIKGFRRAIVAVGSNQARQRLADLVAQAGYELVNAISPRAMISPTATLGQGIAIMAGAILNADCRIEDLAIINTGASIDHDCVIRRAAHVAPQCALAGNVTVGEGSFLGVGCKVIPGIHIGDNTTIGAGGVVVRDLPGGVIAVGVPTRVIKTRSHQAYETVQARHAVETQQTAAPTNHRG